MDKATLLHYDTLESETNLLTDEINYANLNSLNYNNNCEHIINNSNEYNFHPYTNENHVINDTVDFANDLTFINPSINNTIIPNARENLDFNAENLSPVEIKREVQGSTWYSSIFLVVNAALGAGLLNFPLAFHQSGGIFIAILVQLILLFFIVGSMLILVYCAQKFKCATYQDVVIKLCGPNFSHLSSFLIFLYTFGTCVTFFIIIQDQWQKFLQSIYPKETLLAWYLDRKIFVTLTSILFVLPLSYPKRIDFLKYASSLGVLSIFYVVLLVCVKFYVGCPGSKMGHVKTRPDNLVDVFLIIPTICFGYQCHLSLVPIQSCLKKNSIKDFSKTIFISIFICFVLYTATATYGYLSFGSCVQADILLNYKATPDVLIAVVGLAFKMIVSYPIMLFVGRSSLFSLWNSGFLSKQVNNIEDLKKIERQEKIFRVIVTSIWFILSLLASLFVPDIDKVISLLGGLAAIFIFFFPGICLLKLIELESESRFRNSKINNLLGTVIAGAGIVIGGFIFGVCTTLSVKNDIYGMGPTNIPCE